MVTANSLYTVASDLYAYTLSAYSESDYRSTIFFGEKLLHLMMEVDFDLNDDADDVNGGTTTSPDSTPPHNNTTPKSFLKSTADDSKASDPFPELWLTLARAQFNLGNNRRVHRTLRLSGVLADVYRLNPPTTSRKADPVDAITPRHFSTVILAGQTLRREGSFDEMVDLLEVFCDKIIPGWVWGIVGREGGEQELQRGKMRSEMDWIRSRGFASDPTTTLHPLATVLSLLGVAYDSSSSSRLKSLLAFRLALVIDGRCVMAFSECQKRFLLSGRGGVDLVDSISFYHHDQDPLNSSGSNSSEWLRDLYFTMLNADDDTKTTETNGDPTDNNSDNDANIDLISEAFLRLERDYPPLATDITTLSSRAARAYRHHNIGKASELSEMALHSDPGCEEIIFTRVCCLVSGITGGRGFGSTGVNGYYQGATNATLSKGVISELFHYAHQLVENRPERASSWFAVGGYYLAIGQYELAQRYFGRVTRIDPRCIEGWVGFGNAFALQDESDQAMSAYRAGQRLGGSHVPLLFVGMEYLRTNNLTLANHFLNAAVDMSADPCAFSELGVVAFRQNDFVRASYFFFLAIKVFVKVQIEDDRLEEEEEGGGGGGEFSGGVGGSRSDIVYKGYEQGEGGDSEFNQPLLDNYGNVIFDRRIVRKLHDKFWEPTLNNLGHCLRKLRHFDDAIFVFEKALSLDNEPTARSALAFTYHCAGDLDKAIDGYHESLAQHQSAFASEMLNRALSESISAVDEGLFSEMDSFFEDIGEGCGMEGGGAGSQLHGTPKSALSMSTAGDDSIFLDAASGDDVSMG